MHSWSCLLSIRLHYLTVSVKIAYIADHTYLCINAAVGHAVEIEWWLPQPMHAIPSKIIHAKIGHKQILNETCNTIYLMCLADAASCEWNSRSEAEVKSCGSSKLAACLLSANAAESHRGLSGDCISHLLTSITCRVVPWFEMTGVRQTRMLCRLASTASFVHFSG